MCSLIKITLRFVVLILLFLLTACNTSNSDNEDSSNARYTLSISGSTSVGPLAEKLAEKYEQQSKINIEINQVGSSAGITNSIKGVSEIGMCLEI